MGLLKRRRGVLALCAGALALSGSAQAATASAHGTIRVGRAPSPPRSSKASGSLPSDTRLGVAVALQPRDPAGLAAYATAVATPGSTDFHDYVTPAQFAQRFGPTGTQIAAVETSLRAHGLTPGAVSPNGLAIRVTATAGQLALAFSTSFERVAVPGGRTAFANTSAPAIDANVAGDVEAVVGLDTLSVPQPLALRSGAGPLPSGAGLLRSRTGPLPSGAGRLAAPNVATGGPQPCPAATTAAGSQSAQTADQIGSAYDFSGFYQAGDLGANQTVAIYELEGNFPSDVAAYQSCYRTNTSVTYHRVDGGPPAPVAGNLDGLETELDIEDLIGLAPDASLMVYQGPNSNSGSPGSGPYDTYNAIISSDQAQVISTSWGECEAVASTSPGQLAAENTLFQEAAAQGESIVAASGDDGSEDCDQSNGSTALAVDDPASQPFVTGVGGTRLTALGPPPSETVWNHSSAGAGGGGISSHWAMPAYQAGAPASLHVINANSSGVPCGASTGSDCREVPDVSADASDQSSYMMYWNGNWTGVYGTSGAAPTWASLIALANASGMCTGSPIGFANPVLYRAAGSNGYASLFSDITTGNNDWLQVHGNRFPAGSGYDMATGLGAPIGASLPAGLCTVAIANPGAQSTLIDTAVSLQMHATDSAGTASYTASGLPTGLAINASTGLISGTVTTPGTFSVTIRAQDPAGVHAVATFIWTVNPVAVAITGLGDQTGIVERPVSLQISAGDNNGGTLSYGATGLPDGLAINASRGLISGVPTTPGTSAVKVVVSDPGAPTAIASFTWTVNPATVTISRPGAQTGVVGKSVSLRVHAGDDNGRALSYSARGLPRGLSINGTSGLVSGTPKAAGRSKVTLIAAAVGGPPATATVQWTIKAAASATHESLSGVRRGRPALSFTVIAASGSPSIKTVVIGLPEGLSFSATATRLAKGIALKGSRGRRLKFTATVIHGSLRITLKPGASSVRVTISSAALAVTRSLVRRIGHRSVTALSVVVNATNSSHATTRLGLKLGV